MANYSRNTYDPTKGYISARLQQGVPLVDADWNEAADDMRNEFYAAMQSVLPDGFPQGTIVLETFPSSDPNDLIAVAGPFPLGGRLANVPSTATIFVPVTVYSQQRWTDPAAAAHDGVAVIPPLTTPTAARTDTVYADVWEQERNSGDDPNLINPAIGIETCVRLIRTVAIRVAEGATTLPAPPAGHSFVPVAQMNRTANAATITQAMITDLRLRYATAYGSRSVVMFPDLLPFGGGTLPWAFEVYGAYLPPGNSYAEGFVPIPLPDRARDVSISITGTTNAAANIYIYFHQVDTNDNVTEISFASQSLTAAGTFYLNALPAATYIVDRTAYNYVLVVYVVSASSVLVHPLQMNYTL